ncbi:hypothetical protein [Pontibacter akesuensis]|uniref:Uncharacterized protein n=1 Tax=Pontibacter akesuensis TaxID=388950 RepID=A0A1I7IMV3_9BACT|nr:hypothetical protein [Pontibacter akesuensis]GHA67930.1 hypothetical protein GCM10007389_21590 [Pontibacter akesuensis]SFU74216.1 hypothetical protein SAMN04487941_2331 [Pontibacter akesuensis]
MNDSKKSANPWEAYNFKTENNRTSDVTAAGFYVEHLYMWAALEAFLQHDKVTLKTLNYAMANNVPEHINWEVPVTVSQNVIQKMIKIGYIKAVDVPGELPEILLTEIGLKALQNQTFQSLSTTSFFSYQTHLLNGEMHILSRNSYRTSVGVGIVAVLSLLASIAATLKAFGII